MLKLYRENQTKVLLPARLRLDYWLKRTEEVLKQSKLTGALELYFVAPAEIRSLNCQYRSKDRVTDVLSFSFLKEQSFPGDNLVGEIFIEPVTARKQAAAHGVSFKDELEFLFVHSLLHIFGYDHEGAAAFKEMFGLQERIMPGRKWATFVRQIHRENLVGRGV